MITPTCRTLWDLFNDETDVGRTILEQLVRDNMGEHGIPVHDQILIQADIVDTLRIWTDMKEVLIRLVVESTHATVMDRLRTMKKNTEETELSFADRAHLVFQTNEASTTEVECLSVVLGKLATQSQDHIMEQSSLEELTFDDVLKCLRRRE